MERNSFVKRRYAGHMCRLPYAQRVTFGVSSRLELRLAFSWHFVFADREYIPHYLYNSCYKSNGNVAEAEQSSDF